MSESLAMGINKKCFICLSIALGVLGLSGCATNGVSTKAWHQYTRQGKNAADRGDYIQADKFYTAALHEAEQFGPGQKLSLSLGHLVEARLAIRKYAEAEQLAQRRVDMDQKTMLTNTFEFAREILSVAEAQEAQGKFGLAEANYLQVEAIAHDRVSTMVMGLFIAKRARLYTMEGRFSDAERCFEESKGRLETWERAQDPTSLQHSYTLIQTANLLNDYAVLCEKQEKYGKAEDLLEQSLNILEHQTGSKNPRLLIGLNNLARICAKDKKFEKAQATARRSAGIAEKSLQPNDPTRIETFQLLATIEAQAKSAK